MNLDLFDFLGKVKLVFWQKFIGLNELFVVILERGKPHLICDETEQKNMLLV